MGVDENKCNRLPLDLYPKNLYKIPIFSKPPAPPRTMRNKSYMSMLQEFKLVSTFLIYSIVVA